MIERVDVECQRADGGWTCVVRVGNDAARRSRHVVSVSTSELGRYAPGEDEPSALVKRSFAFLLERERKEAILPRFALSEIERYFPEFGRDRG